MTVWFPLTPLTMPALGCAIEVKLSDGSILPGLTPEHLYRYLALYGPSTTLTWSEVAHAAVPR